MNRDPNGLSLVMEQEWKRLRVGMIKVSFEYIKLQ